MTMLRRSTIRLLPLVLTGCHLILPLGSSSETVDASVERAPVVDSSSFDAFVPPTLKCSAPIVVGTDSVSKHGLIEPFLSLDGHRLCASLVGNSEMWCGKRTAAGEPFGTWARDATLDFVKDLSDHTWLDDMTSLIAATSGATRTLTLCQKGTCTDLELLDTAGHPIVGPSVNDMDGPPVGMLDGTPGMVFNTSKNNQAGTTQIWSGRPLDSSLQRWKVTPVLNTTSADDPGIS